MRNVIRMGLVTLATASLTVIAAGGASASPPAASVSPVGTYGATIHYLHQQEFTDPLAVLSDHAFEFEDGPIGKWYVSGDVFTLKKSGPHFVFLYSAKELGKNLGSKADPGTITLNGKPDGTWFAIRGAHS